MLHCVAGLLKPEVMPSKSRHLLTPLYGATYLKDHNPHEHRAFSCVMLTTLLRLVSQLRVRGGLPLLSFTFS